MEEPDWREMLEALQQLHLLSRSILVQGQKQHLTSSELELLSQLFVRDGCTPMELSRQTGMKKEAVSRGLRRLSEKGYITRQPQPRDERSCLLLLTESGAQALDACYGPMLRPLYTLYRRMGPEFEELFHLIARANARMEES